MSTPSGEQDCVTELGTSNTFASEHRADSQRTLLGTRQSAYRRTDVIHQPVIDITQHLSRGSRSEILIEPGSDPHAR